MEKEHTQRLRSILGGLVLFHGEVRGALESSKLKLLEVEMERLMGTCRELEGEDNVKQFTRWSNSKGHR